MIRPAASRHDRSGVHHQPNLPTAADRKPNGAASTRCTSQRLPSALYRQSMPPDAGHPPRFRLAETWPRQRPAAKLERPAEQTKSVRLDSGAKEFKETRPHVSWPRLVWCSSVFHFLLFPWFPPGSSGLGCLCENSVFFISVSFYSHFSKRLTFFRFSCSLLLCTATSRYIISPSYLVSIHFLVRHHSLIHFDR